MAPTTAPVKKLTGLTITCDHCPRLATHRHETPAAGGLGFDVHWTCSDHAPTNPA